MTKFDALTILEEGGPYLKAVRYSGDPRLTEILACWNSLDDQTKDYMHAQVQARGGLDFLPGAGHGEMLRLVIHSSDGVQQAVTLSDSEPLDGPFDEDDDEASDDSAPISEVDDGMQVDASMTDEEESEEVRRWSGGHPVPRRLLRYREALEAGHGDDEARVIAGLPARYRTQTDDDDASEAAGDESKGGE